ncbi:MAG TPA: PAS domain S-box protein [Anaeromyxobacter sp.]|nr:PAS domain S-box protein [Anaeromyxobacter sp.]
MKGGAAVATSSVIFALVAGGGAATALGQRASLRAERRSAASARAHVTASSLEQQLNGARAATHALAAIVQRDPSIPDFDRVAAEMLTLYPGIATLQLLPGGVVRRVYPHDRSQAALGFDVLHDPVRGKWCEATIAARRAMVDGPVELRQGGRGLVVRMPVFMRDPGGEERFWGFTVALLKLDPLLRAAGVAALSGDGYGWTLSRAEPQGEAFANDGGPVADPVTANVYVPNGRWSLALAPRAGWSDGHLLAVQLGFALALAGIFAALAHRLLRQPEILEHLVKDRTEALDRAARQREALLNGIPAPAWLKDRDGRWIAVNEALTRLAGAPPHALVGRRHGEVFAKSGTVGAGNDEAVLARGEQLVVEEAVVGADGVERLFEVVKRPYRDARGEIVGTAGIARDVTDARRAERALRDSEERFRQVVENSDRVFWIAEAAPFRMLYVSEACERVYGVAREAVLADPAAFAQGVHPDDRATVEAVLAPPFARRVDVQYRVGDGAAGVRWARCRRFPVRDERGEIYRVAAIAEDVTEHRAMDERIRASERHLRSVLESSPLAVLQIDRRGVVTAWSSVAEHTFGWTAAEAIGRPIPVVPESDEEEFRATVGALFERGIPVSGLARRRRRKDGSTIDVHISIAPLLDAEGAVREAIVYYLDMTAYRRLEEALQQAQKMEAIGQLAGGVAHDFNNILTVIQMHVQLIEGEIAEGSPEREDLQEVRAAAARAGALTRQLLAFSRRQVMQPKVLDLDLVVNDMLKMLHRLIGEDIDLRVRTASRLWPVRADPGQLEQVVMNLAVNARDAMPGGGVLTITTRNVVLDDAFAWSHHGAAAGEHVVLEVADTGCGMDEATRARAFEPFFTTKPRGKGTGLGLAMVYGIVTQSGGYVDCESAPGRGTTVRVHLPRCRTAAEAPLAGGEHELALRGTQRVLLAEDDDAVRAVTARALRAYGYTVIEARDGTEALAALAAGAAIDVLVSDLVMPDLSGAELVARVRAAPGGTPPSCSSPATPRTSTSAAARSPRRRASWPSRSLPRRSPRSSATWCASTAPGRRGERATSGAPPRVRRRTR